MTAAVVGSGASSRPDALDEGALRSIVLARIVSAGARGVTRARTRRDLASLTAFRLSPGQWRDRLDRLLLSLIEDGLVTHRQARLVASERGRMRAEAFLGTRLAGPVSWTEVRDELLVARALGPAVGSPPRRKRLRTALGLRRAIVERAFGIAARAAAGPAAVRRALALKALGRPAARHATVGVRAGDSRAAAAALLSRPREVTSDGALIALLAAEQVGAIGTDAPSLRRSLLRRLLARSGDGAGEAGRARLSGSPPAAAASSAQALPLADFARAVNASARGLGEGWLGSRRALIARVWRHIAAERADAAPTLEAFKSRLIEAHRAGLIVLANADLRDRGNLVEIERSAVRYKNAEWHFVRVED